MVFVLSRTSALCISTQHTGSSTKIGRDFPASFKWIHQTVPCAVCKRLFYPVIAKQNTHRRLIHVILSTLFNLHTICKGQDVMEQRGQLVALAVVVVVPGLKG